MVLLPLLALLADPLPPPGTPVPPPLPVRTAPPPKYVADCRLVDAGGRVARLRVEVRNAPQANGRIVFADPALAYLKRPSPVTSRSTMANGGGWDVSDTVVIPGTPRGDVAVRLETHEGDPIGSVTLASMQDEDFGRAYEAGMCRVRMTG